MNNELLKHKLSHSTLKTDPFIEIRRCFAPCISEMDKPGLTEAERTCASRLTSELFEQVHCGLRGLRKGIRLPNQAD